MSNLESDLVVGRGLLFLDGNDQSLLSSVSLGLSSGSETPEKLLVLGSDSADLDLEGLVDSGNSAGSLLVFGSDDDGVPPFFERLLSGYELSVESLHKLFVLVLEVSDGTGLSNTVGSSDGLNVPGESGLGGLDGPHELSSPGVGLCRPPLGDDGDGMVVLDLGGLKSVLLRLFEFSHLLIERGESVSVPLVFHHRPFLFEIQLNFLFLSLSLESETIKIASGDDKLCLGGGCLLVKGNEGWVRFLGDFSSGLGDLDVLGSPSLALSAFVEGAPLVTTGLTGTESGWLGAILHTGSLGVTSASLAIFGEDVLLRDGNSLVRTNGGL